MYQTPPQHHLPTGIGSNKFKNPNDTRRARTGPRPPALVTGRPMAITVHRRTATAHIARRLLLVLVITTDTPAEDVTGVKAHGRGRHVRHLAKTLDLLKEQVEGHCRFCRHAHGPRQDRHGVHKDISMGIPNRPAQRLRLAMPRKGKGGRPDAMRPSLPVNTTAQHVATQLHCRLKGLRRRPNLFKR